MRFFEYNKQIVNLSQVTNFTCDKPHYLTTEERKKEKFTLNAVLAISGGFWEAEEKVLTERIELGKFTTQKEGLEIIRDIVAGKHDIPCPVLTIQQSQVDAHKETFDITEKPTEITEPEIPEKVLDGEPPTTLDETPTEEEPPVEEEPPTQEATPTEEQPPDDPEELEKVKEAARQAFKHLHTAAVMNELGITKEKLYGETIRVFGNSDDWNIEKWNIYISALADFQLRSGILYENLKPRTTEENGGDKKGPF